jgi:hypothetical protein
VYTYEQPIACISANIIALDDGSIWAGKSKIGNLKSGEKLFRGTDLILSGTVLLDPANNGLYTSPSEIISVCKSDQHGFFVLTVENVLIALNDLDSKPRAKVLLSPEFHQIAISGSKVFVLSSNNQV